MTAPTSKAFSGLDFDLAIGEVYGLRVWRMDDYGRLRALHIGYAGPWRPGINVATCHAAHYQGWAPGGHITASRVFATALLGVTGTEEAPEPPGHPAPDEQCNCGFYAYTLPVADTYVGDDTMVLGVVRGTGRTLIGAKGFRCEKAEIVALCDPTAADDPPVTGEWMRDRLQAVYPDVPLLAGRKALHEFAPIQSTAPAPSDDEFWTLP